jgi:glycosyltransferase involved in cell wall biosynthesis
MKKNKKQRIFLGPYEVAGYTRNLSTGFSQIGVKVSFIDLWDHPFNYGGNDNGLLENCLRKCKKRYYKNTKKQLPLKLFYGILNFLFTLLHFFKAVFLYDTFIFIFGYSLLPDNIDLPVLKILNKKVISNIAMGSEARPPYLNGVYQSRTDASGFNSGALASMTRKVKKSVSKIEKWSDIVIGSPFSTSQFTQKEFVNTFALGFPRINIKSAGKAEEREVCRILHSPSNPEAKGTALIVEAVKALKLKGYKIEFILLQNKTNSEVLSELENCDFVVDQLYSDTPLGGFACEAASFGKPAVVGGYTLEEFGKFIEPSMMPPSQYCHPGDLQEKMEQMIKNKDMRLSAGLASLSFVQEQWSAASVAKRYLPILSGRIPESYWAAPDNVEYIHGAGQSETRTKEVVTSLVEKYGTKVLQLDHNPALRDKLLAFAGLSGSDR